MMSERFYVLIGEKEEGPFTFEQIERMAGNGELGPEVLVAAPGWSSWVTVKALLRGADEWMHRTILLGGLAALLLFGFLVTDVPGGYRWLLRGHRAKALVKSEVRQHLKSPGTAQFVSIDLEEHGMGYTATAVVDAQNSYGAMIRGEFKMELEPDYRDGFTAKDFKQTASSAGESFSSTN